MSSECCTWSSARAAARTRWPGVEVAIPDDVDASPPAYAVDLLLANACARGDRAAVRTLLREFGAAIDAVLARRGVAHWDRADLHQTLLERLLVDRPGQSARIRSYRGDGPLRGWLRVCIARELLMLQRRRVARVEPIDASPPASTRDPEQHAVVVERERSFVRALGAGLDDLDPRERNVLRLSLLHGLYHEQIAAMYGVHRVTVARWLGGVRDKLRRATWERGRFDAAAANEPPAGVDLHVSQLLGRACEHEA